MAGIVVKQRIDVCEIDSIETMTVDRPTMEVNSHPENNDMVVIIVGSYEYTVNGSELIAACDNAMTTER